MIERYKSSHQSTYTLGITLTIELLKFRPDLVSMVYMHSTMHQNDSYDKIVHLCLKHHISLIENDKVFMKLSEKENCYVIGVFKKFLNDIDPQSNHLMLHCPSNAGNLGTIIRSMVGFGLSDLIIIKPAIDLFNPKTIRASMGSIFHIRYQIYESIDQYIQENQKRAFYPFMLKANNKLGQTQIMTPYTLIFGNEATGLDDQFLNLGTPIKITHHQQIDSLNLPIAVSIALYEFTKNTI
jgi:TrmH family RNA methyltransferase